MLVNMNEYWTEPQKTNLNIRLGEKLMAALDKESKKKGISKSDLVREALIEKLEKKG